MNSRFSRSAQAEKDEAESLGGGGSLCGGGQGILDLSRHSSRYSRSALKKEATTYQAPLMQYLKWMLLLLQAGLIFLFIFGAKLPSVSDQDKYAYSPDEYMIYRDIMAMLLVGFGYLMTFLRKYGLGTKYDYHHAGWRA